MRLADRCPDCGAKPGELHGQADYGRCDGYDMSEDAKHFVIPDPPDNQAAPAPVIELRPGGSRTDDDQDATHIFRSKRSLGVEEPASYCWHKRFLVDEKVERTYCRDCGVEVPLFEAIRTIMNASERWIETRKEAERRATTARENLDELLRQEANAKARARRWGRKAPPLDEDLRGEIDATVLTIFMRLSAEGSDPTAIQTYATRRIERAFEDLEKRRAEWESDMRASA